MFLGPHLHCYEDVLRRPIKLFLARTIPLDLEILEERYGKELRWQLGNPTREDLTLKLWLEAGKIARGPLFRKINKAGRAEARRLGADALRSILLLRAQQAGLKSRWQEPISPHSLRAGFVTTAYGNGVPDEEIMRHTRHKSLATMRSYVRRSKLSTASPAGKIGL